MLVWPCSPLSRAVGAECEAETAWASERLIGWRSRQAWVDQGNGSLASVTREAPWKPTPGLHPWIQSLQVRGGVSELLTQISATF